MTKNEYQQPAEDTRDRVRFVAEGVTTVDRKLEEFRSDVAEYAALSRRRKKAAEAELAGIKKKQPAAPPPKGRVKAAGEGITESEKGLVAFAKDLGLKT